jgi:tetrahydromethanopterin S-methyltransferase subunit G
MRSLTDKELQELMEKAAELGAERAIEKLTSDVYQAVGKKVITKLWQTLGMLAVGFAIWAIQHGWFK